MDRLIASNSVALAQADTAPSTGTPQYATDGNPATNVPATLWPAYAFNALQDEICNVILAAGLTPNRNAWNQLLAAIQTMLQGSTTNVGVDTGAANAYVVAFTPALTVPVPWVPFWIKIAHANTGASTLNATGTVEPLLGGAHAALQGGELVANGNALVYWNPTLASGAGSYVLLFCSGAPDQIALPTQSQHAAQLRQIGSVAGIITTGVSGPITSANAGRSTLVTAGGTTQTINTATLNPGDRFYVYANYNGTSQTTLAISGSGSFISINSISQSTIVLNAGEEVIFTWDGANLGLETLSANLRYSSAFSNNQASNGFQKLPSGLILQWGATATIASGATLTVTLPLAFPANLFFVGCNAQSSSGVGDAKINPGSNTLSTITLCNNGTAGPFSARWYAIGN